MDSLLSAFSGHVWTSHGLFVTPEILMLYSKIKQCSASHGRKVTNHSSAAIQSRILCL